MKIVKLAAGALACIMAFSSGAVSVPGMESALSAMAADNECYELIDGYYAHYVRPANSSSTWEFAGLCKTEGGSELTLEERKAITSVTLDAEVNGQKITSIGDYAFYGYSEMNDITLPGEITHIGKCAFQDCQSLGSFNYLGTFKLESIEDMAFSNCNSVKSITLPATVKTLGKAVFANCRNLTAFKVEGNSYFTAVDGVLMSADQKELIAYPAGKNNTSYSIPGTVTTIEPDAFFGNSYLTSITIPSSVQIINGEAFLGCSALKSVTIPGSVQAVEEGLFGFCESLQEIKVSGGSALTVVDGALLTADKKKLLAYPAARAAESYTIPDSVTNIGSLAFSFSSLKNISIPKSVNRIGTMAFCGCDNLGSLTVPSAVTQIDAYAIGFRGDYTRSSGFIIYGSSNSTAAAYAKENGLIFISESSIFCDLNNDSQVNASDAALVLISSAAVGAGNTGKVLPTSMADVNSDKTVNASDAAMILIYAAVVGAGYNGTIQQYFSVK